MCHYLVLCLFCETKRDSCQVILWIKTMWFALSLLGFGICRASLSVLIVPRHFFLLLFFNEALCCHLGVRLYLRNLETLNTRLEHKLEFDNSVTIDKDLSFTRHISQICKQVKKQSSVFKKFKNCSYQRCHATFIQGFHTTTPSILLCYLAFLGH